MGFHRGKTMVRRGAAFPPPKSREMSMDRSKTDPLGPLYSRGSRSCPIPWSRYRAQSSINVRRRSNRSERA